MDSHSFKRRAFILVASGAAAAATLPRAAHADTATDATAYQATAGSWLQQVFTQHTLISAQLNALLAASAGSLAELAPDLKHLSYLLTAHSVAEENVLYPALARKGIPVGSSELYVEQQWQKVWNAEIDWMLGSGEGTVGQVQERIAQLKDAILDHAKIHEEKELYPKLWNRGNASENGELTVMYRAAYLMVHA